MGARDVAILGEQNVAALAAQHDAVAEQRERRAVLIASDDDGESAPETRIGAAHHLGAVFEWARRRNGVEAQQLLADAERGARRNLLFLRQLDEHAVERM